MRKRTQIEDLETTIVRRKKIYARCGEAALAYSVCENTMVKLAREANAVRKVHGTWLVNTDVLTQYIEQIYG